MSLPPATIHEPVPAVSAAAYHLAGIAGVGMSALAELLLDLGREVTGSDRHLDQGRDLDTLRALAARGARLFPQDGSGLTDRTAALVVSTAVEADNPDLRAAAARGIPVVHRAELLARLAAGKRLIAVAGTSGKTTVTGLLGWTLAEAGLDPTVINGGRILNWAGGDRLGNVRVGGAGGPWVIEADESDRSFLRFDPDWAIVTNISQDHFALDEAVRLFRDFAGRVRTGIVAGPQAAALLRGTAPDAHLRVWPADAPARCGPEGVEVEYAGRTFALPMIGRHNAENALAVLTLAEALGADLDRIRAAWPRFRGIGRRLEVAGRARGVTVVDDYAHNPEKIRAAWTAVAAGAARVFGVWRPHGFGPLALMRADLAAMFAEVLRPADRLFLLPVYYAGGTAAAAQDSDGLAGDLAARGAPVERLPDYDTLTARLLPELRAGDVVLALGARDPELPLFARRLAERLAAGEG